MTTKLSVQEVFTKVATHLLTQKKKAQFLNTSNGNMLCAYRTKEGLKCAIGCLITDAAYGPNLEGCLSSESEVEDALLESGINVKNLAHDSILTTMLSNLQTIHDYRDPETWDHDLKELLYDLRLKQGIVLLMPTIEH